LRKDVVLSMRITEATKEKLVALCAKDDRSQSYMVSRLIDEAYRAIEQVEIAEHHESLSTAG